VASTAVARRGQVPARSKRASNNKADVDIDAILAEQGVGPRDISDIPTFNMTIFGEKFKVLKTVNVLQMLLFDDDDPDATARAVRSVIGLVHDDDQRRFASAYARQRDLTGKALNVIISEMIKAAADPNPSTSQRASGRTAKRTTSRALSGAS